MLPTGEQFEAALQEIEEDTMPPGMTQAQYADAREMMEQLEDVEFYEAMTEAEHKVTLALFMADNGYRFFEEFDSRPVDEWDGIGGMFRRRYERFAVKELREKYRTSGELLECVREAVMGVEA